MSVAEAASERSRLRRRPGLVAVAKRAGVSHQTVSRVVNGFPGVRPATRAKVLAAIEELGYRPNNAARVLVTQHSGLIGVVAVGSFLYGPTSTLAAVEQASRYKGYMVLLATLHADDPEKVDVAVNDCINRGVEAVVIIASRESLVRHYATTSWDVPVLLVGPRPGDVAPVPAISVDQFEGGRMAARHVLDLGHRDVAIVSGPHDWVDAQARVAGSLEVLRAAGVEPTVVEGDWSSSGGKKIGLGLLSLSPMPSAVIVGNDHMALGVLAACASNGIQCPEQISIIGFDDVPGADCYNPPLTTIRQDFTELGHRVLAATLKIIAEEDPDLSLVAPVLTLRASTSTR